MADHHFVVLSRAVSGQEAAFERWYDEVHLGDVRRVPGVSDARRFRIRQANGAGSEAGWQSLAIYDLEGDPDATVASILSRAFGPEMPVSDAMDRAVLQLVVEAVKTG